MPGLVGEIQPREIQCQVVAGVIGDVDVPLPIVFYVGGIGQRSLALARPGEEVIAPVVGKTNLQVFAIVEANKVGRVTQSV